MLYEHIIRYGQASIRLPDGHTKIVRFQGVEKECQRQVNAAAKECDGTAPDLLANWRQARVVAKNAFEARAAKIYNAAFDADKQPK